MFFLGVCKQVLDPDRFPGSTDPYHDFFNQRFAHPTEEPRLQSLHHLLELDTVRRFITTNYDLEIETGRGREERSLSG